MTRKIPGTHIDQDCNANVPWGEYWQEKARNGDAPVCGNPYNTPQQEQEARKSAHRRAQIGKLRK